LKTHTAKLVGFLALLALCASSLAQAQNAPSRIGFVFVERLMTESKMAKTADAKIESEFSKREKNIAGKVDELRAQFSKYAGEAATLTEADKLKRSRELEDKQAEVNRLQREFREDLAQRKNEERDIIGRKAMKIIEQIAEQEKLDLVLHEATWASPRIDITDKVLKMLDK
jgi:outer membrane protein